MFYNREPPNSPGLLRPLSPEGALGDGAVNFRLHPTALRGTLVDLLPRRRLLLTKMAPRTPLHQQMLVQARARQRPSHPCPCPPPGSRDGPQHRRVTPRPVKQRGGSSRVGMCGAPVTARERGDGTGKGGGGVSPWCGEPGPGYTHTLLIPAASPSPRPASKVRASSLTPAAPRCPPSSTQPGGWGREAFASRGLATNK